MGNYFSDVQYERNLVKVTKESICKLGKFNILTPFFALLNEAVSNLLSESEVRPRMFSVLDKKIFPYF